MTNSEKLADHDKRFGVAEESVSEIREEIRKLKLENLDLHERLKAALDIQISTQPILGRMIAACCILERKGVYNVGELNKVQEEQAEDFCQAANKIAARQVLSRPDEGGSVADDSGDGRSGLSGSESTGGDTKSDQVPEDRTRARITRLSDVRAARSASDGTVDAGTSEKKDLPSGQG